MNASDCVGNPAMSPPWVCDPYTKKCGPGECDTASTNCPTNKQCLSQTTGATVGACYDDCVQFGGTPACAAGQFCVPTSNSGPDNSGICMTVGTSAADTPCTGSDTSTGCVTGSLCVADVTAATVCRPTCDYWNSPTCDVGERCFIGHVCTATVGDPAATAGTACVQPAGTPCLASGSRFLGACITLSAGATPTCEQLCRTSPPAGAMDCPTGQTCAATTLTGIGYCM